MNKFFEVAAKCGHVGRDKYYEGHFFVKAQNEETASFKVKNRPRVKRDHEDAILWVKEVDELAYIAGCNAMRNNPYFHCGSKWQQKLIYELIKDGIKPETEAQLRFRERYRKYYKDKHSKDKQASKRKGIRNFYKYTKYNTVYVDEY